MTGQQEVGLSRQTGAKLPSLLPIGTSMQMLASGLLELLLAVQILPLLPPPIQSGTHKSLIPQAKRE